MYWLGEGGRSILGFTFLGNAFVCTVRHLDWLQALGLEERYQHSEYSGRGWNALLPKRVRQQGLVDAIERVYRMSGECPLQDDYAKYPPHNS